MTGSDYLDRAGACTLAALQVQDPIERQTLFRIALAYLRLFERADQKTDIADKLWEATAMSQGFQMSN